ncbi:electron transfer flavoprotein subunit beta/FixA family protein [Thermodesulfobacteriota bacterium]
MEMRVCIKQVPDPSREGEVCFDAETCSLLRDSVPGVINPLDKNALEAALKLREEFGGRVVALSMGPPQAKETLREALVMGVDDAVLISDPVLAGSDTWATSYVLAKTLEQLGPFDLVLCGAASSDGDTSQVGPSLAEFLSLPQVTFVGGLEMDKGEERFSCLKITDFGAQRSECELPALITVAAELNTPRTLSLRAVAAASQKKVKTLTIGDLGIDASLVGLEGSPTQVGEIFEPPPKNVNTEFFEGEPEEMADLLADRLKGEGLP